MKSLVDYAIYFYGEREASVSVASNPSPTPPEFNELFLFCTYVFRQAYNVGQKHPVIVALGTSLSEVTNGRDPMVLSVVNPDIRSDTERPLIRLSTNEVSMLEPSKKRVQKGFSGQVRHDGRAIQFILNPQGFNALGQGINYYVPLSAGLLLNHLAEQRNNDKYAGALSAAARKCGETILREEITMQNQMPLAQDIAKSVFA